MKRVIKQKFPPGWDEKRVRAVIDYYDKQTDEEGAAEIGVAAELPDETWMSVPTELVPVVSSLIANYEKQVLNARSRTRRAVKPRSRKRRKATA